ncbi:MAG: hypothetical protein ACQESG_04240 [Nanobdellota archaeon]
MQIGLVIKTTRNGTIAIIELIAPIKKGDILRLGDHTETVQSMQKDQEQVTAANAGDAIGLLVTTPVKVNTPVYKD